MGNKRREAWELFLKSLQRKPLTSYLQQQAPKPVQQDAKPQAPQAEAPKGQQPGSAAPTSSSSSAQQPVQAAPTAPQQPAKPQVQQQPALTSISSSPAPTPSSQQPQPAAPAQPPSPQPAQFYQIKKTAEKLRGYGYSVRIDACPRCGREGTQKIVIRRSKRGAVRKYVYVYHRLRDKEYACYIGPADRYAYVHRIHGNLALTHLRETNYADVIVHAAEKYIQQLEKLLERQQSEHDEEKRKRISMKIYDIIYALRDMVELARESCENLPGKYREECIMELKDALSCSSSS